MTATKQSEETKVSPFEYGQRTIVEVLTDLRKPIPARLIKHRVQGGTQIDYIEWHTAAKLLDYFAPGWFSEIRNVSQTDARLVLTVRVTLVCSDGQVSREATGQEELNSKGYGDPSSNAEAMAFKRAAAKCGLGLHLYEKDGGRVSPAQARAAQPKQIAESTVNDLDTPVCYCNLEAKNIKGVGKNDKPYSMWVCPQARDNQCAFKEFQQEYIA